MNPVNLQIWWFMFLNVFFSFYHFFVFYFMLILGVFLYFFHLLLIDSVSYNDINTMFFYTSQDSTCSCSKVFYFLVWIVSKIDTSVKRFDLKTQVVI